ncbi:sialate O-acetylesterase [Citrobacter braakii]|uniref:sialate O-acetylesterase n=1 Tax=Citrobacter braakii TaxID=57706 RepID=UPI00352491FB
MSGINEKSEWSETIFELQEDTPVQGRKAGKEDSGPANEQARQLANRTQWLKEQYDFLFDKINLLSLLARRIFIIVITGQSNAQGAHNDGPNPASDKIKVFNGRTGDWGSSNFTQPPFSLSTPDGNGGNNNIALALAHRLIDELQAEKVYIVYDAAGGRPIEDWMNDGVRSERYAAIKSKVEKALATPEIIASGKTEVDFVIYSQGEANALTDTFVSYRDKLKLLDNQFRNELWMTDTTPLFITGMSGLHTRYQVWQAQQNYCEDINRNCIFVNSVGLKTAYDVNGEGDYTHFLGKSLWEHGYNRIWQALTERGVSHRQSLPVFSARGSGPWNGESIAIANFDSIVSGGSKNNDFPVNGPAASHAIHWGYQCQATNYSLSGGYLVTMESGANYSIAWGRNLLLSSDAQYSVAFGFDNTLSASHSFAAGRGHTIADQYGSAVGAFSEYKTKLDDPVRFQVGTGKSATSPQTGFAVFESGRAQFAGDIDFKTDNKFSVGTPSARPSVIYSATSEINLSDMRMKRLRGQLTAQELRAWSAVQPAVYQFLDAIDEKGDRARMHAGFIAQDVRTAFLDEGLDPSRYALFCEDEIFTEDFEPLRQTVTRHKRGPGVVREAKEIDGEIVVTERSIDDALQYQDVESKDEYGQCTLERIPIMEDIEETIMAPVKKFAGTRYGLRYSECLIFEAAYQRSVTALILERLDELSKAVNLKQ